ncbi:MAG TPA: Xaa-Pro peptidase family protein [Spirochaetota bacterium]|nr:Xaa-Pro peptidase family protein [Spirochaetota bacterium]HPN82146.1 Xaa-Pro peptidase family protein [Spirochaetota bacterium]
MGQKLRTAHAVRAARLCRLQSVLEHPLLVVEQPHLFWLSGFSGTSGAAFVTKDHAWFVTDPRYEEQARDEVAPEFTLVCKLERPEKILAGLRLHLAHPVIVLEEETTTIAALKTWSKALEPARLVADPSPISGLRAIKEREEIIAVREALALTEEAMAWVAPMVRPGVTERELAANLELYCRTKGASGPSFDLIVASGPNSARPHGVAGSRRVQANEPVLFDIGFFVDGYASDFTRVVYCGSRPPATLLALHARVLEAQNRGKAAIRAGSPAARPDQIVREWFREQRVLGLYGHSLGHGVGLEIHEAPRLSWKSTERLEAGMLVTVEPGLYRTGRYGVRLEDMVLVTRQGCEVLTDFPPDLARIPLR